VLQRACAHGSARRSARLNRNAVCCAATFAAAVSTDASTRAPVPRGQA
jgi:hypothetical protein